MKKLTVCIAMLFVFFILSKQTLAEENYISFATLQATDNPNEVLVYKIKDEDVENQNINFSSLKSMPSYGSITSNSKTLTYYGEWTNNEMENVKKIYLKIIKER